MIPKSDVLRYGYSMGVRPPQWKQVAASLGDTVHWFDENFADTTRLSRVRCGARVSEDTVMDGEMAGAKRRVALHARPCPMRHPDTEGLLYISFAKRQKQPLHRESVLTVNLNTMVDGALYGETRIDTYAMSPTATRYYECGLEANMDISWIELFDTAERFDNYLQTVRHIGSGAVSWAEAVHTLIEEPSRFTIKEIATDRL